MSHVHPRITPAASQAFDAVLNPLLDELQLVDDGGELEREFEELAVGVFAGNAPYRTGVLQLLAMADEHGLDARALFAFLRRHETAQMAEVDSVAQVMLGSCALEGAPSGR
jgi:hypothetical protein